jgi:hypothetical protein
LLKNAGLFQNAKIIPNKIPNTGLPIMGTAFPSSHAGTAMRAASAIPGNLLAIVFKISPPLCCL